MKSIYLRAAFAVVTIQFESSSSAPAQPGLQWMGSVTNTGEKEDKCWQVQWHFRAAIVSEGVKINCSSARAVKSCWLWILGRKTALERKWEQCLEGLLFLIKPVPSWGDTELVLDSQRHLEIRVYGRLHLMIIIAIKANRDWKTQA